jgi:hypothetical protein
MIQYYVQLFSGVVQPFFFAGHKYGCCHYLHHGGGVATLVAFMKSTSGILPVVPLALHDGIAVEAC